MKTIGLIGGMSWESTLSYYKLLNEGVKTKLGGLHSAKIVLYSVDFAPIARFQSEGEWDKAAAVIQEAAHALEKAGAEMILLCTNTMHKILPLITPHIKTPFLHIADATSKELLAHSCKKVILLGTKFTMQESFYKEILNHHGIEVITPSHEAIETINQIIYQELCLGVIEQRSLDYFIHTIEALKMTHDDIDGVILGCTEIGLLINSQNYSKLPLFDTTTIHVKHAISLATYHIS